MNSIKLQKKFPEVYAKLFASSQLVLSTNLDFLWTDDVAVKHGGLLIYQKIPLKMYLGVEFLTEGEGLSFGDLAHYLPNKTGGSFVQNAFSITHAEKLLAYLAAQFDFEGAYRLHILAELPRGHNLSFSGPLAALLAGALALLSGEIESKTMAAWSQSAVHDLITDKKTKFDYLLHHASELLKIMRDGLSTKGCALSALIHSSYPLVFYSKDTKSKDYVAFRLNEPFKLPEKIAWPIDFALIFSGSTVSPDDLAKSLPQFQQDLSQISADLSKTLQNRPEFGWQEAGFNFVSEFLREDTLWQKYQGMSQVITTVMLHSLKSVLAGGFSEQPIKELFHALNQTRYQARIFGDPMFALNLSYYLIKGISQRQGSNLGIGAKFFGSGRMGGSVLAAIPYQYLRKEVEKVVAELQEEYEVNIDYASWQDGLGEQGIVVEQYLTAGIQAEAAPQGSLILQSWHKNGELRRDFLPLNRIDEQCRQVDILLDMRRRKLFIGGQALSSKEIHSQTAAVDLLSLLLASPMKEVNNSDLPRSSYAQNKHDLLSKVVQPLKKIFKERVAVELPLKVSGGTTDFQISLGSLQGISIALVDSAKSFQHD